MKTAEFKENLYKLINESGLPIANIYMAFEIVKHELDCVYLETLAKEKTAYRQAEQEEENNHD